jgi:hypothetical protein
MRPLATRSDDFYLLRAISFVMCADAGCAHGMGILESKMRAKKKETVAVQARPGLATATARLTPT